MRSRFLIALLALLTTVSPAQDSSDKAAARNREAEESSSRDTRIDISPPKNDAKSHPGSQAAVEDLDIPENIDVSGVQEFHPWNPMKALKNIEVGDFYFKRKNYIGAESRYREALVYKENDAVAIYKLAVCLEKMNRSDEAISEYEGYLKILPYGPEAGEAKKAISRLKSPAASVKSN